MSVKYLEAYLAAGEELPMSIQAVLTSIREISYETTKVLKTLKGEDPEKLAQNASVTVDEFKKIKRKPPSFPAHPIEWYMQKLKYLRNKKASLLEDVKKKIDNHNKLLQEEKAHFRNGTYTVIPPSHSASSRSSLSKKKGSSLSSGANPTKRSKTTTPVPSGNALQDAEERPATPKGSKPPKRSRPKSKKKAKEEQASALEDAGHDEQQQQEDAGDTDGESRKYCVPGCTSSDSRMIGCDGKTCIGEWFHYECVGLTAEPRTKEWYCPSCTKKNKKRGRK